MYRRVNEILYGGDVIWSRAGLHVLDHELPNFIIPNKLHNNMMESIIALIESGIVKEAREVIFVKAVKDGRRGYTKRFERIQTEKGEFFSRGKDNFHLLEPKGVKFTEVSSCFGIK